MDRLTLQTVADYAGGIIRQGNPSALIEGIATDTRDVMRGELFLALIGEKFDGHQFLAQAEQRGALGGIVSRTSNTGCPSKAFAIIEVAETLLAYHRLATAYRNSLPLRVVAITGSNGKTSTKDFTAAVLSQRFRVLKTEGNFNNHIGVPRMVLRASDRDEIAVLEMGMNHPGEIQPLAEIARPDVGIITNIGTAHIEFMGSREAIAQEKGMLAESIGIHGHVILPADDPFAPSIAARTSAQVITAGLRAGELRAENIRTTLAGSEFAVTYQGSRAKAAITVPGEHMIVNALFAIAAGLVMEMPLEEAAEAVSTAKLTRGRLEMRKVGSMQLIDDSYNANPDSMVAALNTLAALPCRGRRIAVLGRMGELGIHSEAGHRRVGIASAESKLDCVITVGDEAAVIAHYAESNGVPEVYAANDTEAAASILLKIVDADDIVLVKGSRSAGMERIISALDDSLAGQLSA